MFKLHKFDIAWNEVETRKIRRPDHIAEGLPFLVVPNGAVKRLIRSNVKLGLIPVQRSQGRLWIEVNGKHAISLQRKKLRQMCSGCRLPGAAFEIDNSENLTGLRPHPMRNVTSSL